MNLLRILLTPSCWIRNERACPFLSAEINRLLDDGEIPEIGGGGFQIRLGHLTLWGCNYPYAYGSLYEPPFDALPNRGTVFRLHDAVRKYAVMEVA